MNFNQWFEVPGNLFLEIKDSLVAFLPKHPMVRFRSGKIL